MSGFWVMLGIVIFVMLGQAVLWSWVIIESRRKIPGVKVFNLRELGTAARELADTYYSAFRRPER